ncbi:MAG: hypothetical protein HQL56_12040 [Magnetococcales bacterium]|nr:hypothetical protein [Magnetococcales bacterium]
MSNLLPLSRAGALSLLALMLSGCMAGAAGPIADIALRTGAKQAVKSMTGIATEDATAKRPLAEAGNAANLLPGTDAAKVTVKGMEHLEKRLTIPAYRLNVQTAGTAKALGKLWADSHWSSAIIALNNIDEALLQRLTDQGYADFVTRLRNAGFEVVEYADLPMSAAKRKADENKQPVPYKTDFGGLYSQIYSPTKIPYFMLPGDALGPLEGMKAIGSATIPANLASENKLAALTVTIKLPFAKTATDGILGDIKASSVLGVDPGSSVTQITMAATSGSMQFSQPSVTFDERLEADAAFGTLRDKGTTAQELLIGSWEARFFYDAVPAVYEALALESIKRANQVFVENLRKK